MPRELIIMRHAHAKTSSCEGDKGRELKDKGKRNAQRMGVWLAQQGLVPDCVLVSSAERARTTAYKMIKSSGRAPTMIAEQDDLYLASPQTILSVIQQVPNTVQRLMIIGHNPGLLQVLAYLCKADIPMNNKGKQLPQATLVHMDVDVDWHDVTLDCAQLKEIVYSKKLPELFPYPSLDSEERRERPAYYYAQSGVVPFRENAHGELEVLIVSSSNRRHWVFPKGIHDPGLSAQASAAQEAFEEAGAMGEVLVDELGQYTHEKWGAKCQVKIYPMRVGGLLDENKWQENHRLRQWVKLEDVAKFIEISDLVRIAHKLPLYLGKDV